MTAFEHLAVLVENRVRRFAMLAPSPALDAVRRGPQAGSWTDFGALSNAVSVVLVGSLFLFFIADAALQLR